MARNMQANFLPIRLGEGGTRIRESLVISLWDYVLVVGTLSLQEGRVVESSS